MAKNAADKQKSDSENKDFDSNILDLGAITDATGEALRERQEELEETANKRTKTGRLSKEAKEAQATLQDQNLIKLLIAPVVDTVDRGLIRVHPKMAIDPQQKTSAVEAYSILAAKYAPNAFGNYMEELTALFITLGIGADKYLTFQELKDSGKIVKKEKSKSKGSAE